MADSRRHTKPALGYLLAVVNALVSGVAVYINSLAVGHFNNPVLYTALKDGVTGTILLLFVLLLAGQRARFRRLTRRDWTWLILVSLVGGSVPYALFFIALKTTSPVTGALGSHLEFVIVALVAWSVLHERVTPAIWAALGVLLAATLLSLDLGLVVFNSGTILIAVASLLFALEYVIVKHLLRGRLEPTTVMTAKLTLGTAVLFGYVAATGGIGAVGRLSGQQISLVLLTGVTLLAFTASIYVAIRHARVTTVAAIGAASPLVTVGLEVGLGHRVSVAWGGIPLLLTLIAVVAILVLGLRQETRQNRALEGAT